MVLGTFICTVYNGILVPVRTSFGLRLGVAVKRTMYQLKVDVDMLNAVKSVLADVSNVSPSSEQRLTLETSANTLFTAFSISTSTSRRYIVQLYSS